jgi:mxaJ protein
MYLAVPFTYDISIGVRKDDTALRDELDQALERERDRIRALLGDFRIPLVDAKEGCQACASLP